MTLADLIHNAVLAEVLNYNRYAPLALKYGLLTFQNGRYVYTERMLRLAEHLDNVGVTDGCAGAYISLRMERVK